MKIAIVASGFLPVIDGVTVSGLQRLRKLSEWGHEVVFFCPDYTALSHVYPNWKDYTGTILPGVRVVSLASNGLMGLGFDRNVAFASYQVLLKELKQFQPDLIHVDEPDRLYLGFLRIPGIEYARSAKIPCVSFYRTNFIDYIDDFIPLPSAAISIIKFSFKKLLLKIYNSYDLTLVSSKNTHKKLINFGIKNTLYGNLLGFDRESFCPNLRSPDFWADQFGIPGLEAKTKLIFLGRLTPDKGWNFTIDALSLLKSKGHLEDVAILIVGDGPMRQEIGDRLSGISSHVYLLGRIPPAKIPSLLANCDIHVTTSEKETRGLTVLEAFASGIPVLAPRAGGVMENIQEGWNGLLFTPQDQDDFGQKLQVLIHDAQLRQTMGSNASSEMESYSWDHTVQNLVDIWKSQISSNLE